MSFDNHTNFGYATILIPPIPALSGTTLTLAAGGAALLPAAPFNATVWPAIAVPYFNNAEIVRVTNIVGDVITIQRAQEGSNARAIVAGDQFANTITTKVVTDLESAVSAKQDSYAVLTTLGLLASAVGWLHNDGAGILAYSTPTASDVGAEPSLGNPAADGYVLSSTAAGVRSWIPIPSAPVTSVFGRVGNVIAQSGDYTKSDVGLGNVENTALSTWAGSSNLTTLGTITTGVWNGTAIGVVNGGTGLTSISASRLLWSTASNTLGQISLGLGMNVTSSELRTPQDLQITAEPQFRSIDLHDISANGTFVDFVSTGTGSRNWTTGVNLVSANGNFSIYDVNAFREVIKLDTSGNTTIFGSIQSGTPSGGTAQLWKLGEWSGGLVRVEIAGTSYLLAASSQDLRNTANPTFAGLNSSGVIIPTVDNVSGIGSSSKKFYEGWFGSGGLFVVKGDLVSSFGLAGSGTDNYIRLVGNATSWDIAAKSDDVWGVAEAGVAYRLTIAKTTGNTVLTGNITTGTPSGGTAKSWKFGEWNSGLVRVEVDGSPYQLAASGQDLRTTASPTFAGFTAGGFSASGGNLVGPSAYSIFGAGGISSGGAIQIFDATSADKVSFLNGGSEKGQFNSSGLLVTGSIEGNSTIKTGAPSGGTAKPWKLGDYTAGIAAQAGKVRVEIDGVAYDLLTA